jgi:hypothetical protein
MHIVRTFFILSGIPAFVFLLTFSLPAASADASTEVDRQLQNVQSPEEVRGLFVREKDPNRRAQIVAKLDKVMRMFSADAHAAAPEWASSLLEQALKDSHKFVFETTVRQIGAMRAGKFADSLILLYDRLPAMFNGSPTPMRLLIIETLGKLGGDRSAAFLIGIVDRHFVCQETDAAVQAMGVACDQRFVVPLANYIEFLKRPIAEMGKKSDKKDKQGSFYIGMLATSQGLAQKALTIIQGGCSHD